MIFLVLSIAIFGHLAIWCAVFNQIHATPWKRVVRKFLEKLIALIVIGLAWLLTIHQRGHLSGATGLLVGFYLWICLSAFGLVAILWVYRKICRKLLSEVVSVRSQLVDIQPKLKTAGYAGPQARLLGRIPGNQSLKLSMEHRIFQLPNWPRELDGLVVAHLSDFHFNGKICQEYFQQVARRCHECNPDLILITGDIVENAACLDWLPSTLGAMTARFGKFYILGNHDLRVGDEQRLRSGLAECGFTAVGGEWLPVAIRGTKLFLAGNELPWFKSAETLVEKAPGPSIVLSHSPDQIFWAEQLAADLVLAGHCHGGQIRLPVIGPLVAPSRYGVRFASGTFKIGQTIMHVSKGLSGDDPIRLNCPPELNIIKINSHPHQ